MTHPTEVFVPYQVARLTGGQPHPAVIVESASMAAVAPPDITYKPLRRVELSPMARCQTFSLSALSMPDSDTNKDCRMARVAVSLLATAPEWARAAYWPASSPTTGIRTASARSGFHVNNDLIESARRDLTDLGVGHITLARINDYATPERSPYPRRYL